MEELNAQLMGNYEDDEDLMEDTRSGDDEDIHYAQQGDTPIGERELWDTNGMKCKVPGCPSSDTFFKHPGRFYDHWNKIHKPTTKVYRCMCSQFFTKASRLKTHLKQSTAFPEKRGPNRRNEIHEGGEPSEVKNRSYVNPGDILPPRLIDSNYQNSKEHATTEEGAVPTSDLSISVKISHPPTHSDEAPPTHFYDAPPTLSDDAKHIIETKGQFAIGSYAITTEVDNKTWVNLGNVLPLNITMGAHGSPERHKSLNEDRGVDEYVIPSAINERARVKIESVNVKTDPTIDVGKITASNTETSSSVKKSRERSSFADDTGDTKGWTWVGSKGMMTCRVPRCPVVDLFRSAREFDIHWMQYHETKRRLYYCSCNEFYVRQHRLKSHLEEAGDKATTDWALGRRRIPEIHEDAGSKVFANKLYVDPRNLLPPDGKIDTRSRDCENDPLGDEETVLPSTTGESRRNEARSISVVVKGITSPAPDRSSHVQFPRNRVYDDFKDTKATKGWPGTSHTSATSRRVHTSTNRTHNDTDGTRKNEGWSTFGSKGFMKCRVPKCPIGDLFHSSEEFNRHWDEYHEPLTTLYHCCCDQVFSKDYQLKSHIKHDGDRVNVDSESRKRKIERHEEVKGNPFANRLYVNPQNLRPPPTRKMPRDRERISSRERESVISRDRERKISRDRERKIPRDRKGTPDRELEEDEPENWCVVDSV